VGIPKTLRAEGRRAAREHATDLSATLAPAGDLWERHRAELPWGRPDLEDQWRLRDMPDEMLPWCHEVRALRRADALLRTAFFRGADAADGDPVLFVPGWSSTPYSWRHVIPVLAANHPVWYFETREKASSRLRHGDRLTVADMAADLREFIRDTLATRRYGIIAASMSAVLVLQTFAELDPAPAWVVLVQPHITMPVPAAVQLLRLFPRFQLEILRYLMLPAARRANLRRAGDSLGGFYKVLGSADMAKLRTSLVTWRGYPGLDLDALSAVTCPSLVVGVAGDRLHSAAAARRIARGLPAGAYLDGQTFAWTHTRTMAEAVLTWARSATA
jgi:pimeloyl-ACP methyl ester carboxylesterase